MSTDTNFELQRHRQVLRYSMQKLKNYFALHFFISCRSRFNFCHFQFMKYSLQICSKSDLQLGITATNFKPSSLKLFFNRLHDKNTQPLL